jgi:hypothetical protein
MTSWLSMETLQGKESACVKNITMKRLISDEADLYVTE